MGQYLQSLLLWLTASELHDIGGNKVGTEDIDSKGMPRVSNVAGVMPMEGRGMEGRVGVWRGG